jgi:hypothetical protein
VRELSDVAGEARTKVDHHALERACQQLPECRTFLLNFFSTCGDYDVATNKANYLLDLELYHDKPHIRRNTAALKDAFDAIVQQPVDRQEQKPYLAAQLDQYFVSVWGDIILAIDGDGQGRKCVVAGLEKMILAANREVRLGLGKTPDFDIVYVFQQKDGFGYAFNLDAPELSEWGYVPAPFRSTGARD